MNLNFMSYFLLETIINICATSIKQFRRLLSWQPRVT